MKTAFYLIIGLLCMLTFNRCEKEEEEPLPRFNGTCTGHINSYLFLDTYCLDIVDTILYSTGELTYESLCLDTFNLNISGSCKITFEDDKYYLVINIVLEHYNINYDIPNKVLVWSKFIIIEEKGTFDYNYLNWRHGYVGSYSGIINFYPENKEQYSISFKYGMTGGLFGRFRSFNFPYLVTIEDSMKFCTKYEYDTLSSQFVCIKDTIRNIPELEINLVFNWDCFEFTK